MPDEPIASSRCSASRSLDFLAGADKATKDPAKPLSAPDADAPPAHGADPTDRGRLGRRRACQGRRQLLRLPTTPKTDPQTLDRSPRTSKPANPVTPIRRAPSPKAATACACARGCLRVHDGPFGLFKATQAAADDAQGGAAADEGGRADKTLGCNTCHSAHKYDRQTAQVAACAGCHDDTHTRAYFGSPHHELFKREIGGQAPRGSGVSCATCHMPATEAARRATATRRSSSHTIRTTTCVQTKRWCAARLRPLPRSAVLARRTRRHRKLIAKNFKGRPGVHVESIEWAKRRDEGACRGSPSEARAPQQRRDWK